MRYVLGFILAVSICTVIINLEPGVEQTCEVETTLGA